MSKTQTKIIKTLEKNGYLTLKTIRLNKNGFPDVFGMKQNKSNIWIECKEAKDTLKPLQKLRIDELNQVGNISFCYQDKKGIIYPETYTHYTLEEIFKL